MFTGGFFLGISYDFTAGVGSEPEIDLRGETSGIEWTRPGGDNSQPTTGYRKYIESNRKCIETHINETFFENV